MPDIDNFSDMAEESGAELTIGFEVEYPTIDESEGDEKFISEGRSSNRLRRSNWRGEGEMTYDATVGAEIVTQPMDVEDGPQVYSAIIEEAENMGYPHQPTGIMTGNTAGLHIHISSISRQKAKRLYEMSCEPWMHVFCCSSVVQARGPKLPVFRGGSYCRLGWEENGRYDVVNGRGGGRYEWRLPEPMTEENFQHVTRFLKLFAYDEDVAEEYAKHVLRTREDEITSIIRAQVIGIPTDFESLPLVSQSSAPESESFFERIDSTMNTPRIYRVTIDGRDYYAFEAQQDQADDRWMVGGFGTPVIEFDSETVIHADTLELCEEPDEREEVIEAITDRDSCLNHDEIKETPATKTLKDVMVKSF